MLVCAGCGIVEIQAVSRISREIPAEVARSRVKRVLDRRKFVGRHQAVAMTVWQVVHAIDHVDGTGEVCSGHGGTTAAEELAHRDGLLRGVGDVQECLIEAGGAEEEELDAFDGRAGEITVRQI